MWSNNIFCVIATVAVVRILSPVDAEQLPHNNQQLSKPASNSVAALSTNGDQPMNTQVGQSHSDLSGGEVAAAKENLLSPCICGVFLSGQFVPGSNSQPSGNPALTHEQEESFSCNASGNKQCTNKCLDALVKHLSNSPTIICGTIDRDSFKERAYLWIKNCSNQWTNTNLAAGREYCCKGGIPYKCPIVQA